MVIILAVSINLALFFLLTFLVQFLWNEVMTFIFHLPELNYWQAAGGYLLYMLLFKSNFSQGDKK